MQRAERVAPYGAPSRRVSRKTRTIGAMAGRAARRPKPRSPSPSSRASARGRGSGFAVNSPANPEAGA